jgi:hypothetical protein
MYSLPFRAVWLLSVWLVYAVAPDFLLLVFSLVLLLFLPKALPLVSSWLFLDDANIIQISIIHILILGKPSIAIWLLSNLAKDCYTFCAVVVKRMRSFLIALRSLAKSLVFVLCLWPRILRCLDHCTNAEGKGLTWH